MPRVDMGNGTIVDFPDTLSPDDLNKAVAQAASQIKPKDQRSLGKKAWDALAIPAEMSRKGLQSIIDNPEETAMMIGGPNGLTTQAVRAFQKLPENTGSLPYDVARGTPKVAMETLRDFAPGFISRGSMMTAGAAKVAGGVAPLAKAALRSIGTQGEELSGIAPKAAGALEAAYKDPSILKATKQAASRLYETAKASAQKGTSIFEGMYKPEEILDTAKSYLAKGGALEPTEALVARKAVDALARSGRYVKDELMAMRQTFDEMAKASKDIAAGDILHQRGRFGEVLSKWAPQNKYGGASAFKLGIIAGLKSMGVPEAAIGVAFSPRLQGLAAAGTGMAARGIISPLVGNAKNAAALRTVISEALRKRRENAGSR